MSKRKSVGANSSLNNTLFNYFMKSPTSAKKCVVNKSEEEVHKSSISLADGNSQEFGTNSTSVAMSIDNDGDNKEEPIVGKMKRRRILDSDSDQENSSDNSTNTTKKKKTHVIEKQDESVVEKTPKQIKIENKTFEEKIKTIGDNCGESSLPNEDVDSIETDLDVPISWKHNQLDFLKPQNIKDKKGRRPDHPDYDCSTLFVPQSYLDSLTPGVRQWWDIKSERYDCILFFKVGKFYELYHMDADVGVSELGFTYMKGDFAHSGFPEQSYDRMASRLIDRGYKVARIEQTETPDMMQERVKLMTKPTKFDKVVKREVCQVTNRGTEVFGQQVAVKNDHTPNYMLAICEKRTNNTTSRFGVCFIDTTLGQFNIGEFDDDKQCSRLLTFLAHYPCVVILYERNRLSPETQQVFKAVLSHALKEHLLPESQFWNASKTLQILGEKYFNQSGQTKWPDAFKSMQSERDHLGLTPSDNYTLALRSLGACLWYLKKCIIDEQILDMARFTIYEPFDNRYQESNDDNKVDTSVVAVPNRNMILDSITLNNLNIISGESSLLLTLDNCCTKFGKRLLHHVLCAPSCERLVIIERQEAVKELIDDFNLLNDLRTILGKLPDLERMVAQIHSFGNVKRSKSHPDGRAVLFEQKTYNKKKIQDFVATINGFDSLRQIPKTFSKCTSKLLKRLTQQNDLGEFPHMDDILPHFTTGFNHEEALKEGIIAPTPGFDKEYDSCLDEIKSIERELADYLKKQEKYFGCRLAYFGTDKKRFQLEIPEGHAKRADDRYTLEGQKKGSKPVKRYHTEETRDFLKRMQVAEDNKNAVLRDISRRMFERFSTHFNVWKHCIDSAGMLDVLSSFAVYGNNQKIMCFPDVLNFSTKSFIEIDDGYHPCLKLSDDYIPNGISLGDTNASFALVTGPNMGGKSTLMRQIGLLIIMSQIGCPIPANGCRLTLIDRIFTRLGANDDIVSGQSTFLVELSETSAILKYATVHSFVLLDELGRGTATYDGTAIAAAVANFLANVRCRTLFSTHYHNLVESFSGDSRLSLGHMACMVENEDSDDPTQETVTFLYKYTEGPSPKSYGFNAAKLAGIPNCIIKRAYELSKQVESSAGCSKLFSKVLQGACVPEITNLFAKCNFKN